MNVLKTDCTCLKELVHVKNLLDGAEFYGSESEELCDEGIQDIKLEYFMTESEFAVEPDLIPSRIYGIEIVKKSGSHVEIKKIHNFSFCRECTRNILGILARNTVTPVSLPFILDDMIGT